MRRVFYILMFSLLATLAFADGGAAYVLKARISVGKKEYLGYFQLWGYIYLPKESLKSSTSDISKFTDQVKGLIYGDTVIFYSEIIRIKIKNSDLIMFPVDKKRPFNKHLLTQIYPIKLIADVPGRGSYSQVTSSDAAWLLSPIHTRHFFNIDSGASCGYTVLYYNKPTKETITLVNAVESELRKEATADVDRHDVLSRYLEKLRILKVIIFGDCSC